MNKTLRSKIYTLATRRTNGITAYEVASKFEVSRSSASAALAELANSGKLYSLGTKRRVPTGRTNTIYFR